MSRPILKNNFYCITAFAVTALLLTLIQPPVGLSFAAWFAYVPFILITLSSKKTSRLVFISYIVAFVYWLGNIYWIGYVTVSGWVAFCAYTALLWPVLVLTIRAAKKYKVPLFIAVPVLIVGVENLQGFGLGGFYWRHLSHSQYANTTIIQIADIFGAAGVSFLVAMVNAFFAELILAAKTKKISTKKIIIETAIVLLALVAAVIYGRYRINESADTFETGPVIAAVQSNLPQSVKDTEVFEVNRKIFERLLSLSSKAQAEGARLIVWPETIIPSILDREVWPYLIDPQNNIFFHNRLCEHSGEGVYLLVGAPGGQIRYEQDGSIGLDRYNSAFLYKPDAKQAAANYDKIHLVPFGEVMPFKNTAPWLYRFLMLFSPYDFDYNLEPGDEFTVFEIESQSGNRPCRFAVMICYESTIPKIARQFALDEKGRKKVDWLVNISNDGWFVKFSDGDVRPSTELTQHTIASVFRAVENRISVLRSVNTGISCLIDPLGRIKDGYLAGNLPNKAMQRTGVEGYFADKVIIDGRATVFSRFGRVLDKFCLIVVLGVLILLFLAPVVRNTKRRMLTGGKQNASE